MAHASGTTFRLLSFLLVPSLGLIRSQHARILDGVYYVGLRPAALWLAALH